MTSPFSLFDWLGEVSVPTGKYRAIAPSETVDRVRKYFPILGITRVADVTGLDRVGIPVTVVARPNSRSVAISQGKGISLAAAQASGVMEAIETYVAEKITLPLKYASHDELMYSHTMIDLDALPAVDGVSYQPHVSVMWIEGLNLVTGTKTWLPYELVHTNYVRPLPPGSGYFLSSSNGLASGNNRAEAVSHAICEVIERDAIAIWSVSPEPVRAKSRVRLDSITDPVCAGLIAAFDAADIDVAIWDVTSDIGVPTSLVWITERGNKPVILARTSVGAGSHPDPCIALSRALTEAAQERLTLIAGARDDLSRDNYASSDFSEIFRQVGQLDFASTDESIGGLDNDVDFLLKKLKSVGISEVVCVDISPELFREIAVVRVVIPGLESAVDDPRYVPGQRALRAMVLS